MEAISHLILKNILSYGPLSYIGDGALLGDIWADFSEKIPPNDDLLLSHVLGILNDYWECAQDKQTDEDKKLEAALKFVILYKEISEPNRVLSDRFKPYQIQPEA
ncbi:hypothetical protein LTR72_012520, partial [Exophiala xenobiotica]